jgi:hypothetical protein
MESSYTRSMFNLVEGPKELRRKLYRNLMEKDNNNVLLEWRPVQAVVQRLRTKLGSLVLFFYIDLCPDVIAVVWRRPLFQSQAFSAMNSEYVHPVTVNNRKNDTLVTLNVGDILRESVQYTADIVINIKIFDNGPVIKDSTCGERKIVEAKVEEGNDNDSDSGSTKSDSE